jgi:hypothetical protein
LFREANPTFRKYYHTTARAETADCFARRTVINAGAVDGKTSDGTEQSRQPRLAKQFSHCHEINGAGHHNAEQWRVEETDVIADNQKATLPGNAFASEDASAEDQAKDDGEKKPADTVIE